MSKNTDTTTTEATTDIFELIAQKSSVEGELETKIAGIKAQADADIVAAKTEAATTVAELTAQIESHPRHAEIKTQLLAMAKSAGIDIASLVEKGKRGAKPSDGQPHFELVNRVTGEVVKDKSGDPIQYSRMVLAVKPSLLEVIGNDLSQYALKNLDTGVVLDDELKLRKGRGEAVA